MKSLLKDRIDILINEELKRKSFKNNNLEIDISPKILKILNFAFYDKYVFYKKYNKIFLEYTTFDFDNCKDITSKVSFNINFLINFKKFLKDYKKQIKKYNKKEIKKYKKNIK